MRHNNPPDPVYAPNSFGGPKADPTYELPNWQIKAGEIARTAYMKHANDDDFGQPSTLYREVLSGTDRDHLVTNCSPSAQVGQIEVIEEERVFGSSLAARGAEDGIENRYAVG